MSETGLRKLHRTLGMIVVIFLAVQVITGLSFSLSGMTMPPLYRNPRWVYSLHHGGGMLGNLYRVILAVAVLTQGITGLIVFVRTRIRQARARK